MKIFATLTTLALLLIAGCGIPKEITSPTDGKTMVLIPAGEFEMGSENKGPLYREYPVHTVYVDAFYMDTHEVTNAEYQKFVLANPGWWKHRLRYTKNSSSYLRHWNGNNYPPGQANHPVRSVCWYDAMAYAQWVGKRLPTEAEWEKAARGGLEGKQYPWGDTIKRHYASYSGWPGTVPVGRYPPNGYGLYEMAGNVREWCLDVFSTNFYYTSPKRNPLSVSKELPNRKLNGIRGRVVRGGSWGTSAEYARVSARYGMASSSTCFLSGFRCVKDVKDPIRSKLSWNGK